MQIIIIIRMKDGSVILSSDSRDEELLDKYRIRKAKKLDCKM